MKILIATDKFKGCLTSPDAAAAIAAGARDVAPSAEVDLCPIADGGEGTVDALVAATLGHHVSDWVTSPLPGTCVKAQYGMLKVGLRVGKTFVAEMAAASGLALVPPDQRDPERTTTFGTGELIRSAGARGAQNVILGIGGSATTDGGVGCAQACGVSFEMSDGSIRTTSDPPLTGGDLGRIRRVIPRADPLLINLRVACDVDHPLFGPRGAARVFGPQKGATPEQVERLDAALERLADLVGARALASAPGAGAAGGLGFGLMAFLGASLEPGFEIVAGAVGLDARIAAADLVLTGEGRLDASSLGGKTAIGVARRCRAAGVPCVALCGSVDPGVMEKARAEGLTAALSLCPGPISLAEATAHGPELLRHLTRQVMQVAMCLPRR